MPVSSQMYLSKAVESPGVVDFSPLLKISFLVRLGL